MAEVVGLAKAGALSLASGSVGTGSPRGRAEASEFAELASRLEAVIADLSVRDDEDGEPSDDGSCDLEPL